MDRLRTLRPPRHLRELLLRFASAVVTVVALHAVWGPLALAQNDAQLNELLEKAASADEEKKVSKPTRIPPSSVTGVNLKVTWRLWKRVFTAGRVGDSELDTLIEDARSAGVYNQPQYAMSVAALAQGVEVPADADLLFQKAEALAPHLPYPYLLHSSYMIRRDTGNVPGWGRPLFQGLKAGAKWPDTSFPWLLKLLSYLLLGIAASSVGFVLGQLIRNFGIAAHDVSRLLPKSFSASQTSVLLLAAVVVPGLVLKSPLISVMAVLAVVSLVQAANERIITLLVFGLVAALPFADRAISDLATYQSSVTQTLARAQYIECDDACREELEALTLKRPEDGHVLYTVLLAHYRRGRVSGLEGVVERSQSFDWPTELRGPAHNLTGAALVALGRPADAIEELNKARPLLPKSPAPAFNLMRAHDMKGDSAASDAALKEASSKQIEVVTEYLDFERRDVNSYLMAEPLPLIAFWKYHQAESSKVEQPFSPLAPFWPTVAGPTVSLELAQMLAGGGLLLALLGFGFATRTSTPCPRCGLARDPREIPRTGDHDFCLNCYSTFVAGASLDYDTRIHNEKVLTRREGTQRLFRRLFSLLLPGVGHHMAGHSGSGFAISFFIVFGALVITRPLGVLRPTYELAAENWAGQVTIAWLLASVCFFIALNALLRDIPPVTHGGR